MLQSKSLSGTNCYLSDCQLSVSEVLSRRRNDWVGALRRNVEYGEWCFGCNCGYRDFCGRQSISPFHTALRRCWSGFIRSPAVQHYECVIEQGSPYINIFFAHFICFFENECRKSVIYFRERNEITLLWKNFEYFSSNVGCFHLGGGLETLFLITE